MGLSLLVSILLSAATLDVSDPWQTTARAALHVDIDDPWSDVPPVLDRDDPWAAARAAEIGSGAPRQIDRDDPWAP